jgi:hypothetical protein
MITTTSGTARRRAVATLAVVLTLAGAALSACGSTTHTQLSASSAEHHRPLVGAVPAVTQKSTRVALYTGMRTLWAQHMEWTYAAVVAFAGGSPALDPTLGRLLRNQADIGTAFAGYYGPAAGARLTDLLRTHIQDAVPVLVAAKAGDTTALDQAVVQWYANAQDIADFLAQENPHWQQAEMRSMMHTHITQTIAYAADLLAGHDTSAIEKYDLAEEHMAQMADMLSAGIVQQFPQRFSDRTAVPASLLS